LRFIQANALRGPRRSVRSRRGADWRWASEEVSARDLGRVSFSWGPLLKLAACCLVASSAPAATTSGTSSSGSGSDGGPDWLKMPGWFIPKQFEEPIEVPEVHVPAITLPLINVVSSKVEAQELQVSPSVDPATSRLAPHSWARGANNCSTHPSCAPCAARPLFHVANLRAPSTTLSP
jgi:hypothetical protein